MIILLAAIVRGVGLLFWGGVFTSILFVSHTSSISFSAPYNIHINTAKDECDIANIMQSSATCNVFQRCGITQVLQVISTLLLTKEL
jgi:hypothetical protein